MPRPTSLTPAWVFVMLVAVLGIVIPASASPVAGLSTVPAGDDPLRLQIERLTPSIVTGDRDIVLSGTVTNVSDETWIGINIAPFRGAFPITDAANLAAAADLPADAYVGDRLVDVASIYKVESLAPGASTTFSTTIPRERLNSAAGVYWVGVHASGETATQPRDDYADGRARTFLPVASADPAPLRTSLVLSLRAPVLHTPEGRIAEPQRWAEMLREGGQLHGLLEAGELAGDRPVTWLVDAAVPHAVSRLAVGNPGWSLAPVPRAPSTSESPDGAGSPEPTIAVLPAPAPAADEEDEESQESAEELSPEVVELAQAWLTRFRTVLAGDQVLALPYGDLDVAALTETEPVSVAAAHTRSAQVLTEFGLTSSPAIGSPEGDLSQAAVQNSPSSALVLLTERTLSLGGSQSPTTGRLLDRNFATLSSGVLDGGPGPEPAGGALAVRQRVASEAVLRGLTGDTSPLVVSPPAHWDAEAGAGELFALFDSRRFRLRSLNTVVNASNETLPGDSLDLTEEQLDAQIPTANIAAAQDLVDGAGILESILTRPAHLDVQVRDTAWTALGLSTRESPRAALRNTRRARAHIDALLASVTISGPASATLSGATGRIGTTVSNSLPVGVTVTVLVESPETLEVEVPNPVRLAPDSRRRLLLETTSTREGIQMLSLRVSDAEGQSLGGETSFPVRSSEIGRLLWFIMGAGALILFGAIGLRFYRRGLASRGHQEEQQDEQ